MSEFERDFRNEILRTWLVVDLSWEGRRDVLWISVCLWQGFMGRWGCPAQNRGWLEEVHILGTDQVQFSPAESKQTTIWQQAWQGGSWKGGPGDLVGGLVWGWRLGDGQVFEVLEGMGHPRSEASGRGGSAHSEEPRLWAGSCEGDRR